MILAPKSNTLWIAISKMFTYFDVAWIIKITYKIYNMFDVSSTFVERQPKLSFVAKVEHDSEVERSKGWQVDRYLIHISIFGYLHHLIVYISALNNNQPAVKDDTFHNSRRHDQGL